jgi:hypothetical protein
VDRKQVQLDEDSGTIRFQARSGRSVDLDAVRRALEGARLFPREGLRLDYLEVTVAGEAAAVGKSLRLKALGGRQEFILVPGAGRDAAPFRRLQGALKQRRKVTTVTGRVSGWSGSALPAAREENKPTSLVVTAFE